MSSHIVLCPNPKRDRDLALTLRARDLLTRAGLSVCISPLFRDLGGYVPPAGAELCDLAEAAPGARLVVTFGGDGTILHAARAVVKAGIPILGVNLGNKGFLAALEPEELPKLVEAATGGFTVERRMMADVELVRDGEAVFTDCALNDAVVEGFVSIIRVQAFGDGHKITEFSGNGIVLATPTGSTAYSMAAGGPLVEPTAENLILTPICAHMLAARSFVLAPDRQVTVRAPALEGKRAILTVDGSVPVELREGDELRVKKSADVTLLANLWRRDFYRATYEKLGGER